MVRKINGFSKWLNPQIFAFGIFQTRSLIFANLVVDTAQQSSWHILEHERLIFQDGCV